MSSEGDAVVQLLAPLVAGALAAGAASWLDPPRTLRRDLQAETEMLARLPSGPRQELRREIDRRGRLLVAYVRFPQVTAIDVLAVFLVVAVLVTTIRDGLGLPPPVQIDTAPQPAGWVLGVSVLMYIGVLAMWSFLYLRWAERARNRLDYLRAHLATDVKEMAVHLNWGAFALQFLGLISASSLIGVQAWRLFSEGAEPSVITARLTIGAVVGAGLTVWLVARRTRLQKTVDEALRT